MSEMGDTAKLLGFTTEWFALAIVNETVLEELRADWDKGEDPNTEHYRWRAFSEFLASHRPVNPDLAMAHCELGAADMDWGMGGAMMVAIVYLPECPAAVLSAAAASGRPHLLQAVARRRA